METCERIASQVEVIVDRFECGGCGEIFVCAFLPSFCPDCGCELGRPVNVAAAGKGKGEISK